MSEELNRFTQIEQDDFMSDPLGIGLENPVTRTSDTSSENEKSISTFKIIIIGDQSVGKTSILSRFTDNTFSKEYQCTISVENKCKNLRIDENNTAQLQLWDTAGEEKFRTVTKTYYHDSHGALITYSIDDRESFNKLESWIKDLKEVAPDDCVIMIVGNKSDLNQYRKVEFDEGKNFAQKYNALFFEVSAKNGSNVALVFEQLAFKIFQVQKNNKKLGNNVLRGHERGSNVLRKDDDAFTVKKKKCCFI